MARQDKGKSTDVFKSGRFRPGVHKVRRIVNWPQDYCTVCTGHKQPTYDDLSVLQWSQGFIQGVIEESSNTVRNTMFRHFVSCMQDATELSFPTAKCVHACVLQEMEKGTIDWQDSEKIDRIRNRNTQCILALPSQKGQVESAGADKTMLCKLYNKGVCRYQNQTEHVDKGVTYQHFCSNCLASTGKKYEHPKHQCLRLKNDKKRPLIYRRFDGCSNSSYNAYMTAKNGTICTDYYFWNCRSDNNSESQTYNDSYISVTKERDSGLQSGHYVAGDTSRTYVTGSRGGNASGETHNVHNPIEGDHIGVATDHKVFGKKNDSNRTKERKQSNTTTVSQCLNVNAIPFRKNITHNIENFNVYAKVFCLSACNNTGPGYYVDNAGRTHKIVN